VARVSWGMGLGLVVMQLVAVCGWLGGLCS